MLAPPLADALVVAFVVDVAVAVAIAFVVAVAVTYIRSEFDYYYFPEKYI